MSVRWSNRKQDSAAEQALGEFLDCYFYPKLPARADYQWHRHADKETQIQGIDVDITYDSREQRKRTIYIDEKAALQYINNDKMDTFALELSFFNAAGIETDGWFLNDGLKTEYYLFIWPRASIEGKLATKYDLGRLSRDDFTQLFACLVKRESLKNWISDQEYDARKLNAQELRQLARTLREMGEPNERVKKRINDDLSLCRSAGSASASDLTHRRLIERPINLLVKRATLIELAYDTYLVTKDELRSVRHQTLKIVPAH